MQVHDVFTDDALCDMLSPGHELCCLVSQMYTALITQTVTQVYKNKLAY